MSKLREVRDLARPIFERYYPQHLAAIPLILLPVINLHLTPASDDAFRVGASKVGGLPDLRGETWPLDANGQPMFFVAQFDLAEMSAHDEDGLFPSGGLLSFFLGRRAIENGEADPAHFAVRFEAAIDGLRRASEPFETYLEEDYATPPHNVTFEAGVHVSWFSVFSEYMGVDKEYDQAWNVLQEREDFPKEPFLLGTAEAVMYNGFHQEEHEVALLTMPESSEVLPFVDLNISLQLAFLMPRADLKRVDFSSVRLAHTIS